MPAKRIAYLLFCCTASVLVALVAWLTFSLRAQLRETLIAQHGEILQPLAATQLQETRETLLVTGDLIGASDLLGAMLGGIDVAALVDVRLFDTDGFLISEDFSEALSVALHPDDRRRAMEGMPSSRYHPEATWGALFPEEGMSEMELGVPLIEAVVPLRDDADAQTVAIARYLLNGAETAADLRAVDRQVLVSSASMVLAAMVILGAAFYWGFRQLTRSRRLIEQSNRSLVELNHQLAFADKSSALGTLTAHLVHGLKNPLASLRGLLETGSLGDDETRAHGKQRVLEMQRMIDQLVDVMRDEESELVYEYELGEVCELLMEKCRAKAQRREVAVEISEAVPQVTLSGREGNLMLLILVNLIDNAIEASPSGKVVRVDFRSEGGLVVEVQDEGDGIPEASRERLFVPKKSDKERGSGIGLVISAQLARQLGGRLELASTGVEGTSFQLSLPGREVSD